ncbi:hypothetical protein UCMB321_2168 [Pseudomonas batumici]|uniref:Uncharacterized protein n=1 Tax=Pseudomonas batumici TaxID=226910 RepID=A0A0C2EZD2_9PSED|nr:hypothetical protein UCMB321_2168 [Pseudomonas batumici]
MKNLAGAGKVEQGSARVNRDDDVERIGRGKHLRASRLRESGRGVAQ